MFNSLKNKKIVLTYFGVNTDDVTASLIGLATQEKNNSENKKLVKKMPVLIAECFQNIIRHGAKKNAPETRQKEYFQIKMDQGYVVISSVNLVENKDIEALKSDIAQINELSKEELKQLRKKILVEGSLSKKGGAGLGLIEMAYKTGRHLENKFIPVNDQFSKFFLALTVGELEENEFSIDDLINEYDEFESKDVLLLYKGDFCWDTSSFIIEMLHENFATDSKISNQRLKEITVLIEVIQNAAKHAVAVDGVKEGVMAIFSKENKRSLYCGNYISKEDADLFRLKIEEIKDATNEQITELYLKELLSSGFDKDWNAGLGLYEIARQTNKGIEFSIFDDKDNRLYLAVQVELN